MSNDATEVKLHFLDYWRVIRVRLGLIALVFFLVIITAGLIAYFLDRLYFSKVLMEVKPDRNTTIGPVFGGGAGGNNDPFFIPTQFRILKSQEILHPVIEQMGLRKKWAIEGRELNMQAAFNRLAGGMLELNEVRGTGLIEIGVWSTNKTEARDIANNIAQVYSDKRISDLKRNIDNSLSQLRDEVEKQRKLAEKLGDEATEIRNKESIFDPDSENMNAAISIADRNTVALEEQVRQQRLNVTKLRGQFEQIDKMKPEELKEVLRTLSIDDPTVTKMIDQLQNSQSKEIELSQSGLGENHPRLKALKGQIELFNRLLSEQLNTVRSNQAAKMDVEDRLLKELEAKFKEAQGMSQSDKAKQEVYLAAKSRYLTNKRIYEAAQLRLNTELLESGIGFDPTRIWGRAEEAAGPSKPNIPAIMALAALFGFVIGVGLAFFIEYLDTSVKTLDDIERYLELPVLTVVPRDVRMLVHAKGDTADAETYRILRAAIEFHKPERNANTFTLVSGGPGEGKSTTLNNLAVTCARGGYKVLVVDADLRRPSQQRIFNVENKVGLSDYLTSKKTVEEITRDTPVSNLKFIPSGMLPSDAVGILNSKRMVEFIARMKAEYDLVFFDSPPILGVSDGAVLASECDVTIMVVQHRRFPRAMLQRVKQAVLAAGGRCIGVVLNNVDAKHDDTYTYYSAYNEYYGGNSKNLVTDGEPTATLRPRNEKEDY